MAVYRQMLGALFIFVWRRAGSEQVRRISYWSTLQCDFDRREKKGDFPNHFAVRRDFETRCLFAVY